MNIFIDIIFKHMGKPRRYFETTKNKIFFVITAIQFAGALIGILSQYSYKFDSIYWLSGLRFFGMARILVVAAFTRERFKFLKSRISNTLTQTIIYMIPIFIRICFYLCVGFIYIFAVIGMRYIISSAFLYQISVLFIFQILYNFIF